MTPRELIAAGRRAGFRRWKPGLTGSVGVWCNESWRIDVEPDESATEITIARADDRPGWWIDACTFYPHNLDEVAGVLRAFGVLPSPTGAAA